MINYFKRQAESEYGEGVVYMAVDCDSHMVLKQVEVYGDNSRWADTHSASDGEMMLADQPASEIGLTENDRISQLEFEEIFEKAKSARR